MNTVISVGETKPFTDYLNSSHNGLYDLIHIGTEDCLSYGFIDVGGIEKSHERYESDFLSTAGDYLDKLSGDKLTCVVTSEKLAGLVMVLLDTLRSKFKNVTVYLVLKESRTTDYEEILIERLNKGVLSNVTKGKRQLVDELMVMSLDRMIGGSYSFSKQIEHCAKDFHTINVFSHHKPEYVKSNMMNLDMKLIKRANELSKVSTIYENSCIGEKKLENAFFSLDMPTKICYYSSIGCESELIDEVNEIDKLMDTLDSDTYYVFEIYNLGNNTNISVISTDQVLGDDPKKG